jgi:hypothetical protein
LIRKSNRNEELTTAMELLWKRLDRPGHEFVRLIDEADDRRLAGVAVFSQEGAPCRLDYEIVLDRDWRTRSARVHGFVGSRAIDVSIEVEDGRWRSNGAEVDGVRGCIDVDLNFSPSTNLLPIRRLQLAVGEEASVSAAWLRFSSFALERLDQAYRRESADRYRYSSAGGAFVAALVVNEAGLPLEYAGIWKVEQG